MKGFVYLVNQNRTNYYKIGYSINNLKDRVSSMNMYSPFGCTLISVIETVEPKKIEKKLHNHFKDKRLNGEFFELDESDVDFFKSFEKNELKTFIGKCIECYYDSINKESIINTLKGISVKNQGELKIQEIMIKSIVKIKQEFGGMEVEPSELYIFFCGTLSEEESEKITRRTFGLFLAKNFQSKTVRVKAIVKRVYIIPK